MTHTMDHTAVIDLYDRIVTHKTDRCVVTQLFDQLCELIVRDYPAPDSSMQAELHALFNQKVTPSPDFKNVTPALVPLVILRQIVGVNKVYVDTKKCAHWNTVAAMYKDILINNYSYHA
jgi:hypothetical protein